MSAKLQDESFWSDTWSKYIEAYLKAPPRCGYWLSLLFPNKEWSFLEIAGGSCRDSLYLAKIGYKIICSDFNQQVLKYLSERFPEYNHIFRCEDAFALSLPDKSVDISFHNGFWVLFRNNEQICSLLKEQARVTRKYLVILVHNVENKALVKIFNEKAQEDKLYDIRFFHRNELMNIIDSSGIEYKSIMIKKFGGPVDILFKNHIKNFPNPFHKISKYIVPRLYKFQPWQFTERIACVIRL